MNMQQMPVHAKIKGFESKFRRVVQPHKPGAVVVSLDFNAQELRDIADDSQDPNMLACYVGENKKDMHSITAASIALSRLPDTMNPLMEKLKEHYDNDGDLVYWAFKEIEKVDEKLYGDYRSLGKKVNFTSEYGAMAEKLAMTLMVTEEEAQAFIDAREAAFHVATKWKESLIKQAREDGYIRTRLGAKRHLASMFDSFDRSISSKAERQAVNFRIQGSCAEQTKKAEGRMWRNGIFSGNEFDAVCYGPVHDEVVASVMLEDLFEFLPKMHKLMVEKYADMEVPVVSSIAFGPNFYDQIEIGTEATVEAIQAGIDKMRKLYPELV